MQFDALPDAARPRAILDRLDPGKPGEPPAVDPKRETFFVYVPPEYDPAASWGLLVWVSPNDFGGALRDDVRELLARRRLIWIGAHRAGNERDNLERLALALTAAELAPRHWTIDPARIYVAGKSGGGRLASDLALLWPERFRGGLFVMGCNWYETLRVPGAAGRIWAATLPEPPRRSAKTLHEEHRFVYLTGEKDFNRDETYATERAARDAGFRHTLLLEEPGADHFAPVSAALWERALAFLDGAGAGS